MEEKTKVLFESEIKPIGNKTNPSFYIKVDKKLVTEGLLNLQSIYKVELEFKELVSKKEIKMREVVEDEQTQKQDQSENL